MLEREIREALADAQDDGTRINDIADQFRRGRDTSELIALLDSSEAELVSVGAWILGELHFHLYNSEVLLSRLRGLLDHRDRDVRFHALGALFPALDWREPATQALLQKMRSDPSEGVRMSAEAATARLIALANGG